MNSNKIYLVVIFILMGIIGFLVVLLFMGDSGKYCVPITKDESHLPISVPGEYPLKRADSLDVE